MPVSFNPKGIYKIYFHEHENNHMHVCTGRIANYHGGNIVVENDETGELTILKYYCIQQLFRIKKEEEPKND